MGLFDGKVAIVTGAGRGIGRCEALLLASEGAKVVVNDLGGDTGGTGADATPAQQVVAEIKAAGGEAVANGDDVASFDGGRAMVAQAVDTFGGLDVLVNNAGILRDRMSFSMSEEEWDAVIRVHLKGHFCVTRFAAEHWRNKNKETGEPVGATIVNTASEAGLYGNAGQLNYAAAKAGIAAMTIVEGARAGALRGAGQRHRPRRPHPPARHGDDRRRPARGLRPPGPRERGGVRGVAGVVAVGPDHRPGLQDRRRDRPGPPGAGGSGRRPGPTRTGPSRRSTPTRRSCSRTACRRSRPSTSRCRRGGRPPGQTAFSWPFQAASRRRRLRTLPLGSRGSSSTRSHACGTL